MKKMIGAALLLVVLLFLIPLGLRQGQTQKPEEAAVTLPESGRTLSVLVGDTIQEMDLNEYLWGVVAAEMPASFAEEALKAQAVAARTYSLNKAGNAQNHPDADLCTNYACCQAWISREKARENWGSHADAYTEKITKAVAETNNQVILYQGGLISALFHSSSSTATQDAVEVWGNSVPYLQSVPSPEGEQVPNFHSEVVLTPAEFSAAFLAKYPDAVLTGDPAAWIGDTVYTEGGSVHSIVIGGISVSGAEARKVFSLRSAAFTVQAAAEQITFQVSGFGHGVGMSQYGANTMANEGKTYTDILCHYYTGVTVEECPAALLKDK